MLDGLFGSKSVENVLLYLFINGKGYGSKIQHALGCSLTPLQKALDRLERGGIILSYYEGKTRLYQFNPAYPLQEALSHLLNQAYNHLSTHEKRRFCQIPFGTTIPKDGAKILYSIWTRLCEVKSLTRIASSKSGGWNGQGKGVVICAREENSVLLFQEKGSWKDKSGNEIDFSNVFRWVYDSRAQVISLEHLRLGYDRPVFLFHLAPTGRHTLSSVDSHVCGEDTYFGQIVYSEQALRLNWRVIGPKKNEEIQTSYS